MLNKALSLLLIFSLAFNIAFVGIWLYNRTAPRPHGVARAAPPEGQPSSAAPQRPWAQLNLQAPQERKVTQDWAEVYRKIGTLTSEGTQLREHLLDLLAAEPLDAEAIGACQQRIDRVQSRVRELVVEQMLRTRDALTPEQRARWVRMMKAAGRRRGMGPWAGGAAREAPPVPPGPRAGMGPPWRGMRQPADQPQTPQP